jgi:hypothetical protein
VLLPYEASGPRQCHLRQVNFVVGPSKLSGSGQLTRSMSLSLSLELCGILTNSFILYDFDVVTFAKLTDGLTVELVCLSIHFYAGSALACLHDALRAYSYRASHASHASRA